MTTCEKRGDFPDCPARTVDFRVYLITDRKLFAGADSFFSAVEEALKGGVRAVQLREKDVAVRELVEMAYRMRETTKRHGARLFINERIDVALAVDADGVHLASTGIPVDAARRVAGDRLFVGASCHSVEEAVRAEKDGADFVTFGPVYETPSKMRYGRPLGTDLLKRATAAVSIPVYAIGGIRADRVREVLDTGAYGVALISAVLASDEIKSDAERLVRLLR